MSTECILLDTERATGATVSTWTTAEVEIPLQACGLLSYTEDSTSIQETHSVVGGED